MTIKTGNQGRQGSQMGQAFDDAERQRQAATGSAQASGTARDQQQELNYRQLAQIFSLPAAANTQSEVLTKAVAALEADLKALPESHFDIRLVPMDRESPSLNLGVSLIVIAVAIKQNPSYGVGYATLLLAESAPEPNPISVPIGNGKTVELKQVIGDAYDDIMRGEIRKELARLFPNVPLLSGEARVVPVDFKWSEEKSLQPLRADTVSAATMALGKSLQIFHDLNLSKIEQDSTLTLNAQFQQPQLSDSVGQPIRADVRILFRAGNTQRNPQFAQSQNLEKPTDIARVAGYVDLIHQRQPQVNPYMPQGFQMQPTANLEQFKQFIPRFVITQLKTDNAATLGKQLLALLTVYTLRKQGAWYPAFKPQYHLGRDKNIDLKDIGAIGLETMIDPATGLGTRINTKTDTFRLQDLGALLHATVREGLVISMNISECGDDTWPNIDFAEAAQTRDGERRRDASIRIWKALNLLTNGELEKTGFQMGSEICFNENNRIVIGWYVAEDGEKRSLDDIDTLAMLNLMGERDIKVARDYSDTFLRSDLPIDQRLDARIHILQTLIPAMKITGFGQRVTFRDEFLQAATMAAAAAGLAIKETTSFGDVGGFDVPQYAYLNQALGGYHNTTLFQQGVPTGQGGQYPNQGWRSRWN